jgi:THO complex subunit 2
MAAPLESGPASSRPKLASDTLKKPSNEAKDVPCQTAGLLTALLAIGALRQAVAILSKFPWMIDVYPEIADLMIRVMTVSISGLYESLLVTKERNPNFTQPRARYGASGLSLPPPRKPLLTLWAPTPPSTSLNDFVFFYPDWSERVPLCSSLDDLVDVVEPLLRFVGLHVSRDPTFLTKFLRLGRTHLVSTVISNLLI